jgi:hypothetical protein
LSGGPNWQDHAWHSFEEFEDVDEKLDDDEVTPWGSADEFLNKFLSVSEWNIGLSPNCGPLFCQS